MPTPSTDTKVQSETLDRVRIKLLVDLPVDSKHGARKGNTYDAEYVEDADRWGVRYWITGAMGQQIGVLSREAEVIGPSGKDGNKDELSSLW